MYIRNINKFRAEKRYSAKTTSMDRKASNASQKTCSSWDRAEIRSGLNKYLTKIRKYHEDPFLAETDQPDLFDLIGMWKVEDRKAEEEQKKADEAQIITDKITALFVERNKIEMEIARLSQERHLVFCMDDGCLACTSSVIDWRDNLFRNY